MIKNWYRWKTSLQDYRVRVWSLNYTINLLPKLPFERQKELEFENFHITLHKFINNPRRENKGNHYREGGFGWVILIIIKFGELFRSISTRIIDALRSHIKQSKECFIRYQNTSNLVKKTCGSFFKPLPRVWMSDETLFCVFDIRYYFTNQTIPATFVTKSIAL